MLPAMALSLIPLRAPLGRYSAVRDLLADLEQETRSALKTLFGFSETKSRRRRDAEPWGQAWEGLQPKFINLAPLFFFDQDERHMATDFLTGHKRRVGGRMIHKAADVVQVHESKKVVGFRLVSPALPSTPGRMGEGCSRDHVQGTLLCCGPHWVLQIETHPILMNEF